AARRAGGAVVAVELGGAGRPRGGRGSGGVGVGVHGASLAGPGRDQALAAPVLDLSRDSEFAAKAARVLDLYARIWCGMELGADEYVISADEKSQLQALSRRHPDLDCGPGRVRRVEFEYRRHGTLAYFRAYDLHRAQLMGRVAPSTGIAPFGKLVAQVMATEPYASAKRVFWIVDNGSSHAGATSIARMREAWPTARLVHLPVHASWLNQIEIVFS